MNDGQLIFLVFYGVLYGVMLQGLGGLHAFPWGFSYESPRWSFRLLWRLSISVACFYALPAAIFGAGLTTLSALPDQSLSLVHAACIAFSGLSVFAPYRLFMFLALGLRTSAVRLYSTGAFEEICERRHIRRSAFGQFIALLFFSAVIGIDFWLVGSV